MHTGQCLKPIDRFRWRRKMSTGSLSKPMMNPPMTSIWARWMVRTTSPKSDRLAFLLCNSAQVYQLSQKRVTVGVNVHVIESLIPRPGPV